MATCPTCRNQYDHATFCPRDGARLVDPEATDGILGGRYRLISKVGAGGMGEVYEATHVFTNRRVAVKLLHRNLASTPEVVARLQREAQTTSSLGHPNIVDCLDFGYSDDGQVYLVMEWLEGENLDQRMQRETIDLPTALDIAAQAAAGLAEAHDHGIIHRDLKPANLFLIRDRRGALVVKVLDFGIAKLVMHQTKLTGTGVLIGTPNYMAPEQASGDDVDGRTDIYALGVMLYELVTGSVPFHADSPLAVLHQHTSRMPVPPSARAPERDIPPEVEELIMRCLAKRADERVGSMHELAQALDQLRRAPSPALGITEQPPLPREDTDADINDDLLRAAGVNRGRSWIIVIAIAVLVLGAAAVLLATRGGSDAAPRVGMAVDAAVAAPADGRPAIQGDATAATVATSIDASVAASLDASLAPATPDAGVAPAPVVTGRGKRFTFIAAIATEPTARQPFETAFELGELGPALAAAVADGSLRARLSFAYFRDHAVVHESTHAVDHAGRFVAPITLGSPGKHHVSLELVVGDDVVDRARFDLVARKAR